MTTQRVLAAHFLSDFAMIHMRNRGTLNSKSLAFTLPQDLQEISQQTVSQLCFSISKSMWVCGALYAQILSLHYINYRRSVSKNEQVMSNGNETARREPAIIK